MAGDRNPFEGVTDFFTELSRIREVGLRGSRRGPRSASAPRPRRGCRRRTSSPASGDLVIRVEVAGVAPEDVAITFSGGVLTVSGVRRTELGSASIDSFYIRERPYGSFRRALTLPPGTDDDQITAEISDGLVEITVRDGCAGAEPQRIALKDASSAPSGAARLGSRRSGARRGRATWRRARRSAAPESSGWG